MGTLAAALAASHAQAAVLPFGDATVTASYNGDANGILGLDSSFALEAGSNITRLDPLDGPGGVEYLTADFLFGIDFSHAGLVTVTSNMPVPSGGAYQLRFDFGATLPAAIKAFTLVDASAIGGIPQLSVIDAHTIGLDLSALTWNGDFASFTSRIDLAGNEVPEPSGAALLLLGAAGMALARRRRS